MAIGLKRWSRKEVFSFFSVDQLSQSHGFRHTRPVVKPCGLLVDEVFSFSAIGHNVAKFHQSKLLKKWFCLADFPPSKH